MDDHIPEGLTPEGGKFLCYWFLEKKESMERYAFGQVLDEYTEFTRHWDDWDDPDDRDDRALSDDRLILDTIGIYLWIAWKTPEYDSRKAWCAKLSAKMRAHS